MAEIVKTTDSRRIFIETLNELAKKDDRIIVLYPDVGFNYLNDENNKFRSINTGVTEQSTALIAAAMALDGWKPYVYSMINFVLFRPAEMVRNGIVAHKANVKLIGVKGSSSYKFLGFSHNLLHDSEDMNFCENIGLPAYNADISDVEDLIKSTHEEETPCYIRL